MAAGLAPAAAVTAIHHGPGQVASAAPAVRPAEVPERYALFVGTLEPRKNLELLLELWPRAAARSSRLAGAGRLRRLGLEDRVDARPREPGASARAGSTRSATSATRRSSRSIAARGSWCSPRSTRGSACRCSKRWRWAARWCAAICRCSAKWRAPPPSTRPPATPRPGSRLWSASTPTSLAARSCGASASSARRRSTGSAPWARRSTCGESRRVAPSAAFVGLAGEVRSGVSQADPT